MFVKVSNKFGTAILGVGCVVADSNLNIVTQTEPSVFGITRLKFKCRGASRKIERKDGLTMWKRQNVWCSVDSQSPLASIVKGLEYGDMVFVFGTQSISRFTDPNSGKTRNTLFCSLMDLRIISKADGSQQRTAESVVTEYVEPDSDDFNGFDDL